jgi:DNA modification methylase
MGKEGEGVENDNLYRDKLAVFQMDWWRTWRPYCADNASAYVWGNAEELWRFWYVAGLRDSERLTFRNEIVWDKVTAIGMASDSHRQYATATERCLFFMLGAQFMGNINKDDFWEGFEGLRAYLENEAKGAGLTPRDVQRVTGVGMYGHWFSRSQWVMIPEKHYVALRNACGGKFFARPYGELRRTYDGKMGEEDRNSAREAFYSLRAHFDNTHDAMTDVWRYERVLGEERYGHATPKPVQMIGRIVKSSTRPGDLILEPFAGTGTTLIAAAATERTCYTMDLTPQYVDVTVRRWQQLTGQTAKRESDGLAFDSAPSA